MCNYDLVIRRGSIVDGSGTPPFQGDVAIADGKIVGVGVVTGKGEQEIDAAGCHVTPGFVDIHTHYDGQVTWSQQLAPSDEHGVTTVVIGNCGVGFAPCAPEDREKLKILMEGVEDIPEPVLFAGIPWRWETFPEYLNFLETRSYTTDIAAYIPHAPLRVYVMGDRGVAREPATDADVRRMAELTREALDVGAVGFATSLSVNHKTRDGDPIFTRDAEERELTSIAAELPGRGIFQFLIDVPEGPGGAAKFDLIRSIAQTARATTTFTITQYHDKGAVWKWLLDQVEHANSHESLALRGQIMPRPMGCVMGFDLTLNPFSSCPSYQPIAGMTLRDKLVELRKPELRGKLIEESLDQKAPYLAEAPHLRAFDVMFAYDDHPTYDWPLEESVGAIARHDGRLPQEVAYDMLLGKDGTQLIYATYSNYLEGNLDAATEMLRNPNTLIGLGDGGAHYGMICDASYPTSTLCYFSRDAPDKYRVPVEQVVKMLSHDNAEAIGLVDRGLIRPGYRADLNIINLDHLVLHAPIVTYDLPAKGRRLSQRAEGYVATLVNGVVTRRDGERTGALPGKLVRKIDVKAPLPERVVTIPHLP